jgi:hypothetical protein
LLLLLPSSDALRKNVSKGDRSLFVIVWCL